MNPSISPASRPQNHRYIIWLLLILGIQLAVLFSGSFKADQAHFANDGPLGAQASRIYSLPGAFFGIWSDLYWVGSNGGNYTANFTGLLLWLLGPVGFNKFVVPSALLLLGVSASLFFRQLGFKALPCILGGIAAALNSNFLSNACWGLPSRALALAAMFVALAAAQSSLKGPPLLRWTKSILAGLAIGLSVSEGGDNGAIFSLFFAAYVFWIHWHHKPEEQKPLARLVGAGGKLTVMVAFALLIASQIVNIFFGFTGSGIAGLDQKGMSPEQKWSFATQWSLPKAETLRVIVPGLYGYRLDTPSGGNYWGAVGQDPSYEATKQGFPRHSGAGEYAGVLVVFVALWAVVFSFVSAGPVFSDKERRMIWFWAGAALLATVLSWGRHAPFYQFVYALPYFSTIRNPMKFMHPCHMALMILFAYGLKGLWKNYVETTTAAVGKIKIPALQAMEKKWLIGSGIIVLLSILAFFITASSHNGLSNHIASQGFDPQQASDMAKFSAKEIGWSVFFLVAAAVAVLLILRGTFSGSRAVQAGVLLGVLLVWDLGRASGPWIQYYNYKEKYANNGVFEALAAKANEHRIAMPPLQGDRNFSMFQQIYSVEWLQHQFPYYNIQSLDQPQEPRMAADKQAYREALGANFVRLWELTNTRFVCGMAGQFVDALNQQLDPARQRFKLHTRFNFFQSPSSGVIGARAEESGPFALIEFTGALPRAKLFTQWEVSANTTNTLARLADPAFNPHQTVLVAEDLPSITAGTSNVAPGSVEFVSYAPKRIELKATATAPSVLLLNDKHEADWNVSVDGQPAKMLRCNFLMRGVQLPAGNHTVVFSYQPQSTIFFISLGAMTFAFLLCGFLWWSGRRQDTN